MAEPQTLEGVVVEIIFSNVANGYTVCDIDVDGSLTTAVGIMPGIAPGESVRLSGKWTSHAEYGEQFRADFCEKILPTSESQILLYLSSGIIKGVGPSTARKIVERFGAAALDVMRDDPERLAKIKGISLTKALAMQESIMEKQAVQSVVMFLQPFGVTANFAVKVFRKFGGNAVAEIEKNPYVLCTVEGIGFKTADKIAARMGINADNEQRLQSGLQYVLEEYAQNGHTYLPRTELLRVAQNILGAEEAAVENALTGMLLHGMLLQDRASDDMGIYLPLFFNAEMGIARRLYTILNEKRITVCTDAVATVTAAERRCGLQLSDKQREACHMVIQNGAAVITGGPGTGKTTVINAIIDIMMSSGLEVALCAPTGRAAKRMAETCGMEASTIHRLLELNFSEDEAHRTFGRNEEFPLDEDVVIVDEMSMVDVLLMHALLRALKNGARLIMVGDADQLASVGAGNVLQDIIQSNAVPTCKLTEIYRQAAESMIVVNAHKINAGEEPILNQRDKDFFFMHKNTAAEIMETISDVCADRLQKAYGFDPLTQIQVLSPSRKAALGVTELNKRLQARLNPPDANKREKPFGDMVFREGDKVMQIRNNYDISWTTLTGDSGDGAFNGDVGVIRRINTGLQTVDVLFDGERIVQYAFAQLEELELAYAVTVHKSQGSEFDAVVIPMYPGAPQLMCRNLLYTAITRAKKLAVLVGREEVLARMIENNRETKRYSALCRKIEAMLHA